MGSLGSAEWSGVGIVMQLVRHRLGQESSEGSAELSRQGGVFICMSGTRAGVGAAADGWLGVSPPPPHPGTSSYDQLGFPSCMTILRELS